MSDRQHISQEEILEKLRQVPGAADQLYVTGLKRVQLLNPKGQARRDSLQARVKFGEDSDQFKALEERRSELAALDVTLQAAIQSAEIPVPEIHPEIFTLVGRVVLDGFGKPGLTVGAVHRAGGVQVAQKTDDRGAFKLEIPGEGTDAGDIDESRYLFLQVKGSGRKVLFRSPEAYIPLSGALAYRDIVLSDPQNEPRPEAKLKNLLVKAPTGEVEGGVPVTFRVDIVNTGTTTIVRSPLQYLYDPELLSFESSTPKSVPVPLSERAARRAEKTGPIEPGATSTVVLSFKSKPVRKATSTETVAIVEGARDELDNVLPKLTDTASVLILPRLIDIKGIGLRRAELLRNASIDDVRALAAASPEEVARILPLGVGAAGTIIEAARVALS
jgi:hypothetical protein